MVDLFRKDVYIDMMIRQIYLAFHVWVKISPNDVKADDEGSVTFNCNEVLKALDVSLDEFKRRLSSISVIYKRVEKKSDEDRLLESEFDKNERGEKR